MAIGANEYLKRLKGLARKSELQNLVFELMKEDEDFLLSLKEEEFKTADIYSTDGMITRAYINQSYAAMKRLINPRAAGSVDLILTGRFVNAMFLKKSSLKGNAFTFGNTDLTKKKKIEKNYGADIYGLSQRTFDMYQKQILMPRLVAEIKRRYNIG